MVDPAVKKTKESLIKNLQAKKTKNFKEKQKLATLKEEWEKEFRDGARTVCQMTWRVLHQEN